MGLIETRGLVPLAICRAQGRLSAAARNYKKCQLRRALAPSDLRGRTILDPDMRENKGRPRAAEEK